MTAGTIDVNGFSADFGGLSGTAGAVPGVIINNGVCANATLTVGDNNASSTFSGTLADGNSTLGLNKSGSGTLTLAGTNTYSGNTTVSQGILVLTNTAALGKRSPARRTCPSTPAASCNFPRASSQAWAMSSSAAAASRRSAHINGGTLNVSGTQRDHERFQWYGRHQLAHGPQCRHHHAQRHQRKPVRCCSAAR